MPTKWKPKYIDTPCPTCNEPRPVRSDQVKLNRPCKRCAIGSWDRGNKSLAKNPRWSGTDHIPQRRFAQWQRNAAKREIDWLITIEDVERCWVNQMGCCGLTGVELKWKANDPAVLSLDRIDSEKGYTPENIRLTTGNVNKAKQTMTDAAFLEMCRAVVRHADGG